MTMIPSLPKPCWRFPVALEKEQAWRTSRTMFAVLRTALPHPIILGCHQSISGGPLDRSCRFQTGMFLLGKTDQMEGHGPLAPKWATSFQGNSKGLTAWRVTYAGTVMVRWNKVDSGGPTAWRACAAVEAHCPWPRGSR